MQANPPNLIPGTAVVLGRMKQGVPLPLTHNVNFNHVLHERVLLVAIEMTETPRVKEADRVTVTVLSERIARLELKFGFMEKTAQKSILDARYITSAATYHRAALETCANVSMSVWLGFGGISRVRHAIYPSGRTSDAPREPTPKADSKACG
jgi:K+ transporter